MYSQLVDQLIKKLRYVKEGDPVKSEDHNIPVDLLKLFRDWLFDICMRYRVDPTVVKELDPLLQKLRYVYFGDIIMPEDHNTIVDCLKKTRDVIAKVETEVCTKCYSDGYNQGLVEGFKNAFKVITPKDITPYDYVCAYNVDCKFIEDELKAIGIIVDQLIDEERTGKILKSWTPFNQIDLMSILPFREPLPLVGLGLPIPIAQYQWHTDTVWILVRERYYIYVYKQRLILTIPEVQYAWYYWTYIDTSAIEKLVPEATFCWVSTDFTNKLTTILDRPYVSDLYVDEQNTGQILLQPKLSGNYTFYIVDPSRTGQKLFEYALFDYDVKVLRPYELATRKYTVTIYRLEEVVLKQNIPDMQAVACGYSNFDVARRSVLSSSLMIDEQNTGQILRQNVITGMHVVTGDYAHDNVLATRLSGSLYVASTRTDVLYERKKLVLTLSEHVDAYYPKTEEIKVGLEVRKSAGDDVYSFGKSIPEQVEVERIVGIDKNEIYRQTLFDYDVGRVDKEQSRRYVKTRVYGDEMVDELITFKTYLAPKKNFATDFDTYLEYEIEAILKERVVAKW